MYIGGSKMKIKYICSCCGKEFDNEDECKAHERQHFSKDWAVNDYIKWLNDASEEIIDNQKVTFGLTKQYLESSLDQKPVQVAAIFTNIAKLLAGEQKPTDTPTTDDNTKTDTGEQTGGGTGEVTDPTASKTGGTTITNE